MFERPSEKEIKKLRPKIRMGGTTSHNGKPDTDNMIKKSQAHHEENLRKHNSKGRALKKTENQLKVMTYSM